MAITSACAPKVVTRIPQARTELSFDETPALLANFDRLFAADTNTRTIHSRSVSVTALATLQREGLPGPKGLELGWRFDIPFALQIEGLTVPPENFGWLKALAVLRRERGYSVGQRVGLIVDSDLGHLPAYNARTRAVVEDHLLPKGVTLLYASADTGKENTVNRAIRMADTASGLVLRAVETGELPLTDPATATEIFDGYREIAINTRVGPLGLVRTA